MYLGMFKLKGNTLQPPSAQKGCSLAGLNHRAEEEENLGGGGRAAASATKAVVRMKGFSHFMWPREELGWPRDV